MSFLPASILIANIRFIGDVILTTPLIGLLKEAYPDAAIDLLVNRGTGEFLEKDPRVRAVFYSDSEAVGPERNRNGYLGRIFWQYDLAINMNASDRGSFAVLLASRNRRVGLYFGDQFWKDIWKRLFFSHPIPYPFPIHYARLCQVVAEKLGVPVRTIQAKVFWNTSDQARVLSLLQQKGVERPYFVLHPFARWIYKYWQMDKFAAITDAIAERYHLQPVWSSSPVESEKLALAEAAGLCRVRPALIPGEFDLNQMTCLLSQASFYVGLDTAISHLAATCGIPMVALYGPTIANLWSPWNNSGPIAQQCPLPRGIQRTGNIIIIQSDRACVPCGRAGCDDSGTEHSPCLLEIGIDQVLKAAADLLDSQGEHP